MKRAGKVTDSIVYSKAISLVLAFVLMCGTCIPIYGCTQAGSGGSSSPSSSEQKADSTMYTEGIARGASVVHLVVQADAPLASEINQECIALDGALYGYEMSDIARIDDTSLGFTATLPSGTKAPDDPYAYVLLDAAAFAEPHELLCSDDGAEAEASSEASSSAAQSDASAKTAESQAADGLAESDQADDAKDDPAAIVSDSFNLAQIIGLSADNPEGKLLPSEGTYDSGSGAFLLPISLGYAEFARTPEADDFTLADEALKIVGVDFDESSRSRATLHIDAPADELRDTFDALDAALSTKGIEVSSDATNCGAVNVGSNEQKRAADMGYEVTALSCLAPNAYAVIGEPYTIESKTQDEDGVTDYDVQIKTTIIAEPGSCYLPDTGIEEVVQVDQVAGETQDLGEGVIRIDESSLFVNIYLPSRTIAALAAGEDGGADGGEAGDAVDNALNDAAKTASELALAHKLVLGSGVLSNAWGVPEPQTEVYLYRSEDEAKADDAMFQLVEKAYADDDDAEKARKAFEMMSKILETAGAFASIAEGNVFEGALSGTSGLFGIVAMGLGYGEGELLSLQDVMDKLNSMDNTLHSIDNKVTKIADAIAKAEKQRNYDKDLGKLRDCISHSKQYAKPYSRCLSDVDTWNYDKEKGIEGMTDEQRATLDDFIDSVKVFETELGTTAYKDTMDLGGLITGDSLLKSDSIVQEYFDVIDTTFNWEPETYIFRQAFMAEVGQAYVLCYSTAVTELQVEASKTKKKSKFKDAMDALTESYKDVQKVLQGDVVYPEPDADGDDADITITPSSYVTAALGRTDGYVKNLVVNQLFNEGSVSDIYDGDLEGFCGGDVNPGKVKTYSFDGAIAEGNFETMRDNLAHTDYKSLWEELLAVAGKNKYGGLRFLTEFDSHGTHWAVSWADDRANAETDDFKDGEEYKNIGRIAVTDASLNRLVVQPSRRYTFNWTGDYFDLNDNQLHKGEVLYIADERYVASKAHWYMNATCHSFFTFKAKNPS